MMGGIAILGLLLAAIAPLRSAIRIDASQCLRLD